MGLASILCFETKGVLEVLIKMDAVLQEVQTELEEANLGKREDIIILVIERLVAELQIVSKIMMDRMKKKSWIQMKISILGFYLLLSIVEVQVNKCNTNLGKLLIMNWEL
jgi:hypothetical protein